jgi:hypothetical protein
MNNNQLIKVEIPDETTNTMRKNRWINEAIWAVADVITWMQENVEKWLSNNDKKRKK